VHGHATPVVSSDLYRGVSPSPGRARLPADLRSPTAPSAPRPSAVPLGPAGRGLRLAQSRPVLQRCGGHSCTPSGCDGMSHQDGHSKEVQRLSTRAGAPSTVAPPIVHRVLSSPGQPLPPESRAKMERGLGYDLGHVRVHSGPLAARSAEGVAAHAYTVGSHIVLGEGAAVTGSEGMRVLAHELTHVLQQRAGSALPSGSIPIAAQDDAYEHEAVRVAAASARWEVGQGDHPAPNAGGQDKPATTPRVQRLIRTGSVTCPAAATGIANPHTGTADRRASSLLDRAVTRITNAQAVRAANPADPDVVAVGAALNTVFHLNPATAGTWTDGPPQVRLPVILTRLRDAKSYIDSVVFTVNCITNGAAFTLAPCASTNCAAGTEAFSCHANSVGIVLCPDFWALNVDQRGRTWMHEVMHIMFGFINDWGSPNVHNAHCYAQFVALLNGFNSPAGFRCP
jgi:hypothetical protein